MNISVTKEQSDCIIKNDINSPNFASLMELIKEDSHFLSDCFAKFYDTQIKSDRYVYKLSEVAADLALLIVDTKRGIQVKENEVVIDLLIGERYFTQLMDAWNEAKKKSDIRDSKIIYTYFFYDKTRNVVKIGKSNNPQKRMEGLSCGVKLQILHTIPKDIEKELHNKFKHINVHGEWFKYNQEIKSYIKQAEKLLLS